jgi:polyhydroxyalkanoate synthesis repressor PhaR
LVRPAPPKRRASSTKEARKPPRRGRPPRHPVEPGFSDVRVITRYGNRRLYDSKQRRAVTMADIGELVRQGELLQVRDGDTGQDITKRVLVQLILEEQNAPQLELLPVGLLRALIVGQSDPMAKWLTQYLEAGARWLERQYESWQDADAMSPLGAMFSWRKEPPPPSAAPPKKSRHDATASKSRGERGGDLRDEMAELQRRLAELAARVDRR